MRTIFTKQPKHLVCNSLAEGIAQCDAQPVHAQSLQPISKNVKRRPV